MLSFLLASAAGYSVAAYKGGVAPFGQQGSPSSREQTLRALPFDTPLAYDTELEWAGAGPRLPWMAVWTSELPPADVTAQIADHLSKSPKWRLTQLKPLRGEVETTLARVGSNGLMTHFAVLSVQADGSRTRVTFEFTDFQPHS